MLTTPPARADQVAAALPFANPLVVSSVCRRCGLPKRTTHYATSRCTATGEVHAMQDASLRVDGPAFHPFTVAIMDEKIRQWSYRACVVLGTQLLPQFVAAADKLERVEHHHFVMICEDAKGQWEATRAAEAVRVQREASRDATRARLQLEMEAMRAAARSAQSTLAALKATRPAGVEDHAIPNAQVAASSALLDALPSATVGLGVTCRRCGRPFADTRCSATGELHAVVRFVAANTVASSVFGGANGNGFSLRPSALSLEDCFREAARRIDASLASAEQAARGNVLVEQLALFDALVAPIRSVWLFIHQEAERCQVGEDRHRCTIELGERVARREVVAAWSRSRVGKKGSDEPLLNNLGALPTDGDDPSIGGTVWTTGQRRRVPSPGRIRVRDVCPVPSVVARCGDECDQAAVNALRHIEAEMSIAIAERRPLAEGGDPGDLYRVQIARESLEQRLAESSWSYQLRHQIVLPETDARQRIERQSERGVSELLALHVEATAPANRRIATRRLQVMISRKLEYCVEKQTYLRYAVIAADECERLAQAMRDSYEQEHVLAMCKTVWIPATAWLENACRMRLHELEASHRSRDIYHAFLLQTAPPPSVTEASSSSLPRVGSTLSASLSDSIAEVERRRALRSVDDLWLLEEASFDERAILQAREKRVRDSLVAAASVWTRRAKKASQA